MMVSLHLIPSDAVECLTLPALLLGLSPRDETLALARSNGPYAS